MKKFNPLFVKGWKPSADSPEYNEQIHESLHQRLQESEYLFNIVETGMKLIEEECTYENTCNGKLKFKSSLEKAFDMIQEEKQKFGYINDIFNEEFMTSIKNKSALHIYMAAMIYLTDLEKIAYFRDIKSEGRPNTKEKRDALEKIKDKHRYIMINIFVLLEESNLLTLTEILLQTFNYLLNVRIEFKEEYQS